MFSRLYLDSEPLRSSRWPNVSKELSNLLRLARRLEISLHLPLAVEMELEAQYARDLRKYRQVVEVDLTAHLRRAGIEEAFRLRTEEEVLAAFRVTTDAARRSEGLRSVPLSTRPVTEYFELLLRRDPPFSQDGRGFGDALILLSVLDDLRAVPVADGALQPAGVIITADRRFAEAGKLADRAGVQLDILSLDVGYSKMMDRLVDILGAQFAADYAALVELIRAHSEPIRAFIANNVAFPATSLALFWTTRIESVDDIESVHIERVITEPELWRPTLEPGQRLTLRIAARARILVTEKTWPSTPTRIFRIGQDPELVPVTETTTESTQVQRVIEREVEIDASVTRTERATYADLVLEGARLKNMPPSIEALANMADA